MPQKTKRGPLWCCSRLKIQYKIDDLEEPAHVSAADETWMDSKAPKNQALDKKRISGPLCL